MPSRDFFAFCTSLHPLELRALGALSEVRHLPDGAILYRTGEAAEEWFIIKRGTVELKANEESSEVVATLSRGEICGDLETWTGSPRLATARAQGPVSVQCFQRADLQKLQEGLPSFFPFLCEQLAHRLLHAQQTASNQSHHLNLRGNFIHFDLVTIYQTIVQSSQTGELAITGRDGELIATFRFRAGQPQAGKFRHLLGEEAFWQLFLMDDPRARFSFGSGASAPSPALDGQVINRNAHAMLLTGVQFRDEFEALKIALPPSALLKTERSSLDLGLCSTGMPDSLLQAVWRVASERSLTLGELFPFVPACELKTYEAVQELIQTGHLTLSRAELPQPTPSE